MMFKTVKVSEVSVLLLSGSVVSGLILRLIRGGVPPKPRQADGAPNDGSVNSFPSQLVLFTQTGQCEMTRNQ